MRESQFAETALAAATDGSRRGGEPVAAHAHGTADIMMSVAARGGSCLGAFCGHGGSNNSVNAPRSHPHDGHLGRAHTEPRPSAAPGSSAQRSRSSLPLMFPSPSAGRPCP
ncbi:hypothetical protein [Streptomyces cyanogenus]|uniref:Uncharacterized protein n=1 Tax=Streptomyces cyanogenus TaxID=80860 RepID=A0ABX7TLG1_STRCY|nr:hypothetical protein [Streptomyces cyanogenus]QTD96653.1 hypothetical protein S1361_04785 [Streptomyces cyanogenus]